MLVLFRNCEEVTFLCDFCDSSSWRKLLTESRASARAHVEIEKTPELWIAREEEFGLALSLWVRGVRRRAVCATNLINSRVNNTALIMHSSSERAPGEREKERWDVATIESRKKRRAHELWTRRLRGKTTWCSQCEVFALSARSGNNERSLPQIIRPTQNKSETTAAHWFSSEFCRGNTDWMY